MMGANEIVQWYRSKDYVRPYTIFWISWALRTYSSVSSSYSILSIGQFTRVNDWQSSRNLTPTNRKLFMHAGTQPHGIFISSYHGWRSTSFPCTVAIDLSYRGKKGYYGELSSLPCDMSVFCRIDEINLSMERD